MIFTETKLKGAYIVDLEPHYDSRGYFGRAWCKKEFEKHGLNANLVQCNISYNKVRGTTRGMHYQIDPYSETKFVRCIKGALYDVIIDLRKESDTYGKWIGIELSEKNGRAIYVPEGFAHGFQTLEDDTYVFYQVTEFYTPNAEKGIRWDDSSFNIKWPIGKEDVIISEKDRSWESFNK